MVNVCASAISIVPGRDSGGRTVSLLIDPEPEHTDAVSPPETGSDSDPDDHDANEDATPHPDLGSDSNPGTNANANPALNKFPTFNPSFFTSTVCVPLVIGYPNVLSRPHSHLLGSPRNIGNGWRNIFLQTRTRLTGNSKNLRIT